MPSITEYGYLDLPYLDWPYLTGVVAHAVLSQTTMVINADHSVRSQVEIHIVDETHEVPSEVEQLINDSLHAVPSQIDQRIDAAHSVNSQVEQHINDFPHEVPSQVYRQIAEELHSVPSQVEQRIDAEHAVNSQVEQHVNEFPHDVQQQVEGHINDSLHAVPSQVEQRIDTTHAVPSETEQNIDDFLHAASSQVDKFISGSHAAKSEVERRIDEDHAVLSEVERRLDKTHVVASEVERVIKGSNTNPSEVRRGTVVHEHCEDAGYLLLPYLTTAYLADVICARARAEIDRQITNFPHAVNSQIDRRIDATRRVRSEVERVIQDFPHAVGSQIARLSAHGVGMQITQVLYNTYNLRVMVDFPSRGVTSGVGNNAWGNPVGTGQNWVASSTMAGDFGVSNVNTDIVEQVWRSNTGDITGVTLKCDTEITQGVFIDTLALLNHNLTTSADITLEGSTDSAFGSIGFSVNLVPINNHPNVYYIAPTLPTQGFRYWRISISDPTNTAFNYLQIGTIVFGSTIIFQGECFVDRVRRRTIHFADKVQTEGFTNVSNDRALKYAVGLEFKNLDFNRGNYRNIRGVFDFARTSLKCLWIPTPQFPERFAVFGKLAAIPDEEHNVKAEDADYVDFNLEVDESL